MTTNEQKSRSRTSTKPPPPAQQEQAKDGGRISVVQTKRLVSSTKAAGSVTRDKGRSQTGAIKTNGTLSPPLSTSPSSASAESSTSTLHTPSSSILQVVNGYSGSGHLSSSSIHQNDLATHFVFARNILEASCVRASQADEGREDIYTNFENDASSSSQASGSSKERGSTKNSAQKSTSKEDGKRNSFLKGANSTVSSGEGGNGSLLREANNSSLNDSNRLRIEGLKWMKKLANGTASRPPYGDACAYLADLYDKGGLGLLLDRGKAFNYWFLGSKQSHPYCSFRVAKAYESGVGTKRDNSKALQFYRKASALGDSNAMHRLGIILLYGRLGCSRNDRDAVSWLKRAISAVNCQHLSTQIGQIYGSDDVTDAAQAESLYELACLYEKGTSSAVIRDEHYAFQLYQQAATYGHARAQHRLGVAYESGAELGLVEANASLSVHFYRLAAEMGGCSESQFALSGWYLTGIPDELAQSEQEAYAWARRAADQSLPTAEYAIGYFSEIGIGTKPDIDEAIRWYTRAMHHGCNRAKRRLKDLKRLRRPKQASATATTSTMHEVCLIN